MEYDQEKVDQAVLGLLFLNLFEDAPVTRAWKSLPWEVMDRLHQKGFIADPKSKAMSVVMTEEGKQAVEAAFSELFGQ
ncbi:MAG: DUF6429 family protein [Anaerolineales bacterium]